jgi:hypothetical protein
LTISQQQQTARTHKSIFPFHFFFFFFFGMAGKGDGGVGRWAAGRPAAWPLGHKSSCTCKADWQTKLFFCLLTIVNGWMARHTKSAAGKKGDLQKEEQNFFLTLYNPHLLFSIPCPTLWLTAHGLCLLSSTKCRQRPTLAACHGKGD